jgi:hypothetical protein
MIKLGIDNGNYNTKSSEGMLYASGFTASDREFLTPERQLFYEGSYYAIGEWRLRFQQDKTMEQDTFMRTRLKLFLDWGIIFGKPYEIAEQSARKVEYVDRRKVEEEIIRRNVTFESEPEERVDRVSTSGGIVQNPNPAINLEPMEQKQHSDRR